MGVRRLGEPTRMEPTYEDLLKIIGSQNKRIKDLEDKVEKLEKELHKYHNENTPSSANKHLKSNTKGLHAKGGKRGAPFGHKGTTRRQQPEEFNDVDANECPGCHSNDLEDVTTLNRVTEEIPIPVRPTVTATMVHKKKCRNCGKVFIPPQNTVPLEGKFGINLMVLILFMKFMLRGVLRKAVSFLEYGFAFTISPAAVNSVLKRAANAANKDYEELKIRIKNSTKVHSDATSFSVLGINFWLWVFRTENDILFVIRKGKGNKVLREVLGKNYRGKVICDCAWVYNFLKKAIIQRCWAHLLRKSKALLTVPGKHLHKQLEIMFKEINKFNELNPTEEQRIKKYDIMVTELGRLVDYYGKYKEVAPAIKYIDNHFDQWLNCVRYPDIEPTNNLAEQAIRESVMYRKIIGAFRSKDGPKYYERLASLFATWQLRGLDMQVELRRMLTSNLCFC